MENIKLYTVEEVAEILRVSKRSVYNYIREGRLHATKLGQTWRMTDDDIKGLLSSENKRNQKA